MVLLHRWILGAPLGDVHHCNGQGTDNRRANLLTLSRSEHLRLRLAKRGPSGFCGVYWHRGAHAWGTQLSLQGRCVRTGSYASVYLAAMARDDAVRAIAGPWCVLNFPRTVRRARLRQALLRLGGRDFRVVFVRR